MALEDFKPRQGGKGNSLISPATLDKLLAAASMAGIVLDETQFERQERAGKIHYRLRDTATNTPGARGAGGGTGGSFYGTYQADGDTYLQGGAALGGAGSVAGTLDGRLLYTSAQAASPPLPMSGQSLYVKITVDGIKASNVMLPGLKVTGVAWHGPTSTAPTSDTPTLSATTGKDLYELVGQFTDTGFMPAASGNIPVGGSFGSYTWTR